MKELVAYAREHFAREEIEMKLINFQNINMHMAEHATLLRQVQDTQDQLETGRKLVQMDLYHFLAWWVKDHIRQLDCGWQRPWHRAARISWGGEKSALVVLQSKRCLHRLDRIQVSNA